MKSILRPAFVLFAALTLICCVLYPYAITGIGQVAFASQAEGSIMLRDGQPYPRRFNASPSVRPCRCARYSP